MPGEDWVAMWTSVVPFEVIKKMPLHLLDGTEAFSYCEMLRQLNNVNLQN